MQVAPLTGHRHSAHAGGTTHGSQTLCACKWHHSRATGTLRMQVAPLTGQTLCACRWNHTWATDTLRMQVAPHMGHRHSAHAGGTTHGPQTLCKCRWNHTWVTDTLRMQVELHMGHRHSAHAGGTTHGSQTLCACRWHHSRVSVHVAAVHTHVGGQRFLPLRQLATESGRSRDLGQALDVDGLVLAFHVDEGDGWGSSLKDKYGCEDM